MNAPGGTVGLGLGLGAVAVVVVAVAGFAFYKNRELFNPASDKNLANQAAGAITEALTGTKGATVGNTWFDWTRGEREPDLSTPVVLDHAALQLRAGSRSYREGTAPPPVW